MKSTNTEYQSTNWKDVLTYTKAEEIPANAVKIGTIICRTKKGMDFVYAKCRLYAARYGGHAIFAEKAKPITGGQKAANALLMTGIKGDFEVAVYRLENK